MAGGWKSVGEILVRSGEGEEGAFGRFLFLEGRTAPDPNAPQLDGVGEILLKSVDRAAGYFTRLARIQIQL